MPIQTLYLHRDAPEKPAYGQACNRCGVCCAAEPCPIGRLAFRQWRGSCPALSWEGQHYACGLVTQPDRYLRWLPRWTHRVMPRLALRWIAAGKGCDSTAETL